MRNNLNVAALLSMATLATTPCARSSVTRPNVWSEDFIKPSLYNRYVSVPTFTKPTGKPKTKTELAKKKAKDANKSRRVNRKK